MRVLRAGVPIFPARDCGIVLRSIETALACVLVLAACRNGADAAGRRGAFSGANATNAQPKSADATASSNAPVPASSPGTAAQSAAAAAPAGLKTGGAKSESPKADVAKVDAGFISVDSVAAQVKALDAAAEADEPDRATLLAIYRAALDDLRQAAEQRSQIAELEKERIAAPYQLEILKRNGAAGKAEAQQPVESPLAAQATLENWEQLLSAAERELDTAEKAVEAKDNEEQRRAQRRLEIPPAIAAARIKLDGLDEAAPASEEDSAAVAQSRRVARQAKRSALEAEIALAEKELQAYDNVAAELLTLEREAAAKTVEQLEKRVAAVRKAVNDRREAEANQQATEAHWAAATAEPAIRQLAEDNSALADERKEVTKAIETLSAEREAVDAQLDKVSDQFKQATDKLNAAGLTQAIGQMLLKERGELAQVVAGRRAAGRRQQEISRVQLELFEFQGQLAELRDLDARVRELCAETPHEAEAKPEDFRRLLETKRKYLRAIIDDDNSYFSALVEIDSKQRELLSKADEFRDYIDSRVLWVRSTHWLSLSDAGKTVGAAGWVIKPANWSATARQLFDNVRNYLILTLLAVCVFGPWIFGQRRLRKAITDWASVASTEDPTSVHPLRRACLAAGATFLIAALWPAVVWFGGWLMSGGTAIRGEFPEALAAALQTTAMVMLPLLFARQICRHHGLAAAHFGWPADVLAELRQQRSWLAVTGTPIFVLVVLLESQSNDAWKESLGRLLFIVGQVIVVRFVLRTLRPPSGALHRLMVLRSGSWANRLSLPAFLVLLAVPTALAILAVAGYYYTALRLAIRLLGSVWLVLGLVILQALAEVWLTELYRRFAVKAASRAAELRKRLAATAERQQTLKSATRQEQITTLDEVALEIDQQHIDSQTHRLLHNFAVIALALGLCWVWLDMFPALQFFNQVTLWTEAGIDADHHTIITLANLLEGVLIFALTIVAVANVPSLLEIAVLQPLMLDRGLRYALVAVARYVIVIVGLALAGAMIGIGWGKLQWLVAAMSFGLGFGLQEIFANFVSGLIVLWERPIRIGDTVTVGDVTGTVSRIQIRATTIVDADRKELILPNKDLISGRLVNWTLTDSVIRLVVRVGIAYGSDTVKAQQLLMRVATRTPQVMRTPAPKAVFMGFGEKSLDFELRVFVDSVDSLLPVRHRLNTGIEEAFRGTSRVEFAVPPREILIPAEVVADAEAHADAVAQAGELSKPKAA